MDECVKTKYDTYIEFKFFEKLDTCIKNAKSRERIRTAWLTDKALYTDFTKTIEFEFMNYSLHDASHSISILQCIYMLLGKNKIDRLSVGDLWLLLECAYSHDIGMATCYDELKEFWKNDNEIEKQVRKISVSADRDIISMYKKVRDWINSNGIEPDIINIFKEHYEWPLEIRKAVTYINSEYIRQFHAKRSNDKILEILEEQSRLRIEDRLYKAVGNINYLHGTDFKEIFNLLESQAIGFETDKIHPLDNLLNDLNISHKLIKPRTPRHNGKVERSHRNDQQRFYSYLKFYSYDDLQKQMKTYLKRSNNIPMQVLNWLTPLEMRQQIIEKNNIQ